MREDTKEHSVVDTIIPVPSIRSKISAAKFYSTPPQSRQNDTFLHECTRIRFDGINLVESFTMLSDLVYKQQKVKWIVGLGCLLPPVWIYGSVWANKYLRPDLEEYYQEIALFGSERQHVEPDFTVVHALRALTHTEDSLSIVLRLFAWIRLMSVLSYLAMALTAAAIIAAIVATVSR